MICATSNPVPSLVAGKAQLGPGLKPATTANGPDAAPEHRFQRLVDYMFAFGACSLDFCQDSFRGNGPDVGLGIGGVRPG